MTPHNLMSVARMARSEVEKAKGSKGEHIIATAGIFAMLFVLIQHEADKEAERNRIQGGTGP